MTKYLGVALWCLILAGCAFPAPRGFTARQENSRKKTKETMQTKETMITFTKKDDGGEYRFRVGQTFQVILPENPTTGYRWIIAKPADKLNVAVILVRQEYRASSHDPSLVGSGGVRAMIFQTVNEGLSDLVLVLRRPWEAEGEQVDSFNLSLDIHK